MYVLIHNNFLKLINVIVNPGPMEAVAFVPHGKSINEGGHVRTPDWINRLKN
jgi:hypothetical protein